LASFFPTTGANKVARTALQDLGGKFALRNLVNAKLNISEDLPDKPLSPTTVSRIKMISDANRLEAEEKYIQPFSFKPMCKLLFASNHSLRLKEEDDEAFVNRIVDIPFKHSIPKEKQDKNILAKMQDELSALFNHAFQAYKRLVNNNYIWAGADRFTPNIEIASSGIPLEKELILKKFVNECCVFDENAITPTEQLKRAYDTYCYENNFSPIEGDRFSRELFAVLPDTVVRVTIGNQQRGYRGIKLR
jgi:putative DNA primase/helicase